MEPQLELIEVSDFETQYGNKIFMPLLRNSYSIPLNKEQYFRGHADEVYLDGIPIYNGDNYYFDTIRNCDLSKSDNLFIKRGYRVFLRDDLAKIVKAKHYYIGVFSFKGERNERNHKSTIWINKTCSPVEILSDLICLEEAIPTLTFFKNENPIKLVTAQASNITFIPKEKLNSEVYSACIQNDPRMLLIIDKHLRTREMYLYAIEKDPSIIAHFCKDEQTLEICLSAIKKDPMSILYIGQNLRTPEMYTLALNAMPQIYYLLSEAEKRDPHLAKMALENFGSAIKYLPKELLTDKICMQAVKNDGLAIKYIPQSMWTQELCSTAVKECAHAIQHIRGEWRTTKLCIAAITGRQIISNKYDFYNHAIKFLTVSDFNPEISEAAVKHNGKLVRFIPAQFRTQKIIEISQEHQDLNINGRHSDYCWY